MKNKKNEKSMAKQTRRNRTIDAASLSHYGTSTLRHIHALCDSGVVNAKKLVRSGNHIRPGNARIQR